MPKDICPKKTLEVIEADFLAHPTRSWESSSTTNTDSKTIFAFARLLKGQASKEDKNLLLKSLDTPGNAVQIAELLAHVTVHEYGVKIDDVCHQLGLYNKTNKTRYQQLLHHLFSETTLIHNKEEEKYAEKYAEEIKDARYEQQKIAATKSGDIIVFQNLLDARYGKDTIPPVTEIPALILADRELTSTDKDLIHLVVLSDLAKAPAQTYQVLSALSQNYAHLSAEKTEIKKRFEATIHTFAKPIRDKKTRDPVAKLKKSHIHSLYKQAMGNALTTPPTPSSDILLDVFRLRMDLANRLPRQERRDLNTVLSENISPTSSLAARIYAFVSNEKYATNLKEDVEHPLVTIKELTENLPLIIKLFKQHKKKPTATQLACLIAADKNAAYFDTLLDTSLIFGSTWGKVFNNSRNHDDLIKTITALTSNANNTQDKVTKKNFTNAMEKLSHFSNAEALNAANAAPQSQSEIINTPHAEAKQAASIRGTDVARTMSTSVLSPKSNGATADGIFSASRDPLPLGATASAPTTPEQHTSVISPNKSDYDDTASTTSFSTPRSTLLGLHTAPVTDETQLSQAMLLTRTPGLFNVRSNPASIAIAKKTETQPSNLTPR